MPNYYVPGSEEYYSRFIQSPPSNDGGVPRFTNDPKFQEIARKALVDNFNGPMPVGGAQTVVPGGVYRTNKDGITFFPQEAITNTPLKKETKQSNTYTTVTKDPYAGYRGQLDDLYNRVMGYGSYTPGTYSAKYDTKPLEGQLAGWLNEIDNYGEFKYDLNSDMLYKQMVDNSVQKGQLAAQDVMANAAALSGGYGNSYAASLGNQAYQQFLTDVNNNIPALQKQALSVWQAGLDQLYGQMDAGSQQLKNLLALEEQNFAQWQANEANAFNAWNAGYQQVLDQYNLGVNHIGNIAAYQPVTYSGGSSSAKTGDDVYYRNAYGDALKNADAQMAATPGNPYTQDQLYEALKQQNAYNNLKRYLEQKKNKK